MMIEEHEYDFRTRAIHSMFSFADVQDFAIRRLMVRFYEPNEDFVIVYFNTARRRYERFCAVFEDVFADSLFSDFYLWNLTHEDCSPLDFADYLLVEQQPTINHTKLIEWTFNT